jgi:hypothetical protein
MRITKIAIVGSEIINEPEEDIIDVIEQAPWLPLDSNDTVITKHHGDMSNAAKRVANTYGAWCDVVYFGDQMGGVSIPKENTQIVEDAEAFVIVWNGLDDETADILRKAIDSGKPLFLERIP